MKGLLGREPKFCSTAKTFFPRTWLRTKLFEVADVWDPRFDCILVSWERINIYIYWLLYALRFINKNSFYSLHVWRWFLLLPLPFFPFTVVQEQHWGERGFLQDVRQRLAVIARCDFSPSLTGDPALPSCYWWRGGHRPVKEDLVLFLFFKITNMWLKTGMWYLPSWNNSGLYVCVFIEKRSDKTSLR